MAKTKTLFSPGDVTRCLRTVKLDGGAAIERGILYVVRSTIDSCCHQGIDIGHDHHVPIVHVCSRCGKAGPEDHRLFVPHHYFSRPKRDALARKLLRIEEAFVHQCV